MSKNKSDTRKSKCLATCFSSWVKASHRIVVLTPGEESTLGGKFMSKNRVKMTIWQKILFTSQKSVKYADIVSRMMFWHGFRNIVCAH